MAKVSTNIVVQLFNDYEIQSLILLSFALQVFIFLFGGLRRRNSKRLLSLLIWLAYLSADYIAVYALRNLSRNVPTTTNNDDKLSQGTSSQAGQKLVLLWAPFLLVHLGGQDTVTAFSTEDNELWLRHLLNLLVQACQVLNVLWKSVGNEHDRILLVLCVLVFVAGNIKYGERIWALKCGSMKALRSSKPSVKQWPAGEPQEDGIDQLTYPTIIKYALHNEGGVMHVFSGQKANQMRDGTSTRFHNFLERQREGGDNAAQLLAFKRVEVELSIMYDHLFTKVKMIQTTPGAILRCVSSVSTMVAFVFFIVISGGEHQRLYKFSTVDATITYILFVGAFCLEICAVFILMMSPQALLSCPLLLRIQSSRPWWSDSIGQYNLLSSCLADKKSSRCSTAVGKMMGMVGANELWNNMRHTKHGKVETETKALIGQVIDREYLRLPVQADAVETLMLEEPFEVTLLLLHIWTEFFLRKAAMAQTTNMTSGQTMQRLVDTCKGMSDYMMYLLVVHPAMLPVPGDVHELLARVSEKLGAVVLPATASKEQLLEAREFSDQMPALFGLPASIFDEARAMVRQEEEHVRDVRAGLEKLEKVWVRLLVYAAGKSRPEEHARRLSTGGELLTFVWLLMLHRGFGDQGLHEVGLLPTRGSSEDLRPGFGGVTQGSKLFLFSR